MADAVDGADAAVRDARYVRPVEVVTGTGKSRHAAYVHDNEPGVNDYHVPPAFGVCGRAKNAKTLIPTAWLAKCGERVEALPFCRACWRQVALDEGITVRDLSAPTRTPSADRRCSPVVGAVVISAPRTPAVLATASAPSAR